MKIRNCCNIRIGHAFRERLIHVPKGKIMVVQPRNILPEGIIFENDEPLRVDITSFKPLQSGDVLLVNRGRFAAIVCNLSGPEPWITTSSVLVLSIYDPSVLPEYVALYINSVIGQKKLKQYLEHTTVPFISAKNLGNMDIQIPSIERQKELITFEESVMRYNRLTNRKHELLKEILNSEFKNINEKENK
jgi:restriction endonuclease S subunit